MEFNYEENRIYSVNQDGMIIAEVTFPKGGDKVIEIDHTFVDGSLRGQGVASQLIQMVCDHAKENNLLIKPACSYAVSWFEKNTQYKNLLA